MCSGSRWASGKGELTSSISSRVTTELSVAAGTLSMRPRNIADRNRRRGVIHSPVRRCTVSVIEVLLPSAARTVAVSGIGCSPLFLVIRAQRQGRDGGPAAENRPAANARSRSSGASARVHRLRAARSRAVVGRGAGIDRSPLPPPGGGPDGGAGGRSPLPPPRGGPDGRAGHRSPLPPPRGGPDGRAGRRSPPPPPRGGPHGRAGHRSPPPPPRGGPHGRAGHRSPPPPPRGGPHGRAGHRSPPPPPRGGPDGRAGHRSPPPPPRGGPDGGAGHRSPPATATLAAVRPRRG